MLPKSPIARKPCLLNQDLLVLVADLLTRAVLMSAAVRRIAGELLPSLASWQACLIAAVVVLLAVGTAKAQETPSQTPRAYDICSVKPSSGETSSFRRDPGGGLTATGIPAVSLVVSAFDVHDFQVLGLPRWATTDDYDVACKDTQPNEVQSPSSRMMSGIEALLADRFRLRYHRESRPLPLATLRIGKSGLSFRRRKATSVVADMARHPSMRRVGA